MCRKDVPSDANVFGGCFVLAIKNARTEDELYKARFVVQGHTDIEKKMLVHNRTNLRQGSIRMLIAIAAVFGFRIWSQDVSQVYLQSTQNVMREVYVKPTRELNLSSDQLLGLLKPLCGLADSGEYWHEMLSKHSQQGLCMRPTTGDLSLFFKVVESKPKGMTGAYVNDTIGTGDDVFENESKKTEYRFQSKLRENDKFQFAGIQIEKTEGG